MCKIKVLIFPAGEINSIELHDALSTCVNIELWGASSIERHGSYVFKNYISNVPLINASDFFEKFNQILSEKKIDVIFPTHDTVAEFFANNIDKINAKIICADKLTSEICRDKKKTFDLFKEHSFCPEIYEDFSELPVFIKPRKGQGAVGAKVIKTKNDIPQDITIDDYVICEYLPNEEYTVDCLTDRSGVLRFVSPRSRKRIMAGVSVAGEIETLTAEIKNIAEQINKKLSFMGLWWFQIKQDQNEKWKLLEISTRCAGTMALTRARGVNLPLLSVYTAMGYDISVEPNTYQIKMDSSLIRRYKIDYDYDTVYFDFDDTLTLRGKVNLKAIWFLYQCQNLGKKVILLTKHEKEIYETMNSYHIDKGVFHRIIHIKPDDKKSDFIIPDKAIFIDNSYQERAEVARTHGIPVFDVDGLDVLMDWRQ